MNEYRAFFVDTNIFIRFFAEDNAIMARECDEFFIACSEENITIVISHAVLAEIVWVLTSRYTISRVDVADLIKRIVSFQNIVIDNDTDISTAVEVFANRSVKFIDALIASNPKIASGELPIVSYDKDFDTLGVKRLEPAQVLKRLAKK